MKRLIIAYEQCVGCQSCEQACATKQTGIVSPALSRIRITRLDMGIKNVPIACMHCESAPCMAICPTKALYRDDALHRVVLDYEKCIGCRMCTVICPFGSMRLDTANKKVFKCDLCDGDPVCAKFCQHGALRYDDATEQSLVRQSTVEERLSDIWSRKDPVRDSMR